MRLRFLILMLLAAAPLAAAPLAAHAASIGFASSGILFSSEPTFAGTAIKVYSVVVNNQYIKLTATVSFTDNGTEFGRANVEVLLEEARQVQTQWTPVAGQHVVVAKFVSAVATDAQGNVRQLSASEIESVAAPVSRTVTIDSDSDKDGIGDQDEIHTYHTSPLSKDTDGDGMNDGDEIKVGRNPLVADAPTPPPASTPTPSTTSESAPQKKATPPKTQPTPNKSVNKKSEPAPKQPAMNTISVQTSETTSAPGAPFESVPPSPSPAATEESSETNWVKVLGIIAALLALAAAVSGALAWRERNRY